MSFDLAVSVTTNDVSIIDGKLAVSRENAEVVQRIRQRLNWLAGEWFLDTTKGLPWFQSILGGKDQSAAVMLIRDQITNTYGVDRTDKINVRFDAQKRELYIFAVVVINGTQETLNQGVSFA